MKKGALVENYPRCVKGYVLSNLRMSSSLLFVKPDAKLTGAPFKILLDVCQSENNFITFQSSLKDEALFYQQITYQFVIC